MTAEFELSHSIRTSQFPVRRSWSNAAFPGSNILNRLAPSPNAGGTFGSRALADETSNTFACHRVPPHPRPPPGPGPPGAYLAAQLAAGVDAQRPGHMLALSQGQQQVVGDAAGPRSAPGAAAGPWSGGRRLRAAGRARGAEVVRGARTLGETWALGRHGRCVVRVQQAFGRGAPAGGEQQGRSAGLRDAVHGRAHGTDPHPDPGRGGPCFISPRIRPERRDGRRDLLQHGGWSLQTELGSAPTGAKLEPFLVHAGITLAARPGRGGRLGSPDLRGYRLWAPRRAGAAAAIVVEAADSWGGRGGRPSRGSERRAQDSAGSLEPRSKHTSQSKKSRSESRSNFSAALGIRRAPGLPA